MLLYLIVVVACSSFESVVLASSANAATLPLSNEIYPYSVIEQDVAVVLREFGQNLSVTVQLSPKVDGVVKGKLPRLRALDFLNHVCQKNGLEWYFDGSVLHISSAAEEVTRFLPLEKPATPDMLVDALKQLSFYDERYPIRPGPGGASIFVSGPPAYVALVEQTLTSTHGGHSGIPRETVIYRGASVAVEKFGPSSPQ